ncbi:MAG: hypothetical protein WCK65_09430, partial [Rhodospirillaceae bacterium]
MKTYLTLGICAVASIATYTADAAQLRPTVSVSSDHISIGDLFEGVAELAERQVATAPALGRSLTFDLDALQRMATAYNVDWKPAPGDSKVVVT